MKAAMSLKNRLTKHRNAATEQSSAEQDSSIRIEDWTGPPQNEVGSYTSYSNSQSSLKNNNSLVHKRQRNHKGVAKTNNDYSSIGP